MFLRNFYLVKVLQRNKQLGCIPTSVEWLLKFSKANITWKAKQKKWDLELQEKVLEKISSYGQLPSFNTVKRAMDDLFVIQNYEILTIKFENPEERNTLLNY